MKSSLRLDVGNRRTVSGRNDREFAGLEFDGFLGVPQKIAINLFVMVFGGFELGGGRAALTVSITTAEHRTLCLGSPPIKKARNCRLYSKGLRSPQAFKVIY